jgi:TctA family transporter
VHGVPGGEIILNALVDQIDEVAILTYEYRDE